MAAAALPHRNANVNIYFRQCSAGWDPDSSPIKLAKEIADWLDDVLGDVLGDISMLIYAVVNSNPTHLRCFGCSWTPLTQTRVQLELDSLSPDSSRLGVLKLQKVLEFGLAEY